MIENVKSFFYFLFRPRFWFMNYAYDRGLDLYANCCLDKGVEEVGQFYTRIGGEYFWTSNYPYAYGTLSKIHNARPSRKTILRMREEISKFLIDKE